MNLISQFWKSNRSYYLWSCLIFFLLYLLMGAKNKMIQTEIFWIVLIPCLVVIFFLGFLVSLLLGCHKD